MIVKLYNDNPNPKSILNIVDILRNGGIVIFPTDTVYSMGCDAFNVKTVEQICRIKGINIDKAQFSIICYDLSDISEYAKVDNNTFKLMKRNLPGAFTFILNCTSSLPRFYKNRKTIGVRIPDNDIIRAIVKELGQPIMSTSIKDDDEVIEYTTDPELIYEKYDKLVDVVIDGGYGEVDASTIVDCTSGQPEITRQGKGELIF